MVSASVTLSNPVSGFRRDSTTDESGRFVFRNLPPQSVPPRGRRAGLPVGRARRGRADSVPIELTLDVAAGRPRRPSKVVGHAEDLLERDPTAHTDIDQTLVDRLPLESSGLEPGHHPRVAGRRRRRQRLLSSDRRSRADAVLDRQPAGDRPAEPDLLEPDLAGRRAVDGGHHRRAARGIRRQGQPRRPDRHEVRAGPRQPTGQCDRAATARSTAPAADFNLGVGNHKVGELPVGQRPSRSDRYLDPPEFEVLHGDGQQPVVLQSRRRAPDDAAMPFHLNVQLARSSFDVPNTYDQAGAGQAQHQKITSFNVAPGYTRILSSSSAARGQRLRPPRSRHATRRAPIRSPTRRHGRAGSAPDQLRREGRRRLRPAALTT